MISGGRGGRGNRKLSLADSESSDLGTWSLAVVPFSYPSFLVSLEGEPPRDSSEVHVGGLKACASRA